METLYLLIPISVVLVFLIALAFWWSLRSGQFDDMEGPAYRILMDDDRSSPAASAGDDRADRSATDLRDS
ncbi:MAG TPA: cbb3-type cytochrome oxidase assembly protein CcoS [Candidatus Accumulibacter phosphatis]|nr:MAG: cytochrome oxidase maturation protein, cbb3-type [Candidatus Accumulibacter sp. SK-11]HAY27321.1 cbb3-type cytochrome oxidase assembly protein CcoS [Accumulibacter sp.]HRL75537.1 cbb3-type cytochrome oxidase assembly protein CcoS [Candidatus Accumulibacter phosphatis]HCN68679.1 cbb3-type cytochrome oxidase assembly protein CcoS [Accumulibacter sp.]HCV14233.1 cbb3-type cytochrome oxidase assembly protein CcoS [Accumulibacter sp.]